MLYNLFAFLVKGILFNPMALLGVISGTYGLYHYRIEGLLYLYKSPYLYGAIFLISLAYALLFRHVYHPNSKNVDWWKTIKSSVNHMLTLIIAAILTCVVIILADYIFWGRFITDLDQYMRYRK